MTRHRSLEFACAYTLLVLAVLPMLHCKQGDDGRDAPETERGVAPVGQRSPQPISSERTANAARPETTPAHLDPVKRRPFVVEDLAGEAVMEQRQKSRPNIPVPVLIPIEESEDTKERAKRHEDSPALGVCAVERSSAACFRGSVSSP